ncbi:MAG: class II glutamine amidotransferase [Deltaproteobacteria bacterium]|nr:class II glutamine amidotransferase [Deltaproteobacteria bacterium]
MQAQVLEAFHPLGKDGKVRPWETPGHLDGWGMAKYTPQGPLLMTRSGGDVDREGEAYGAASMHAIALEGALVMVHFRKATIGDVRPENAQPFVHRRWLFAHNGTIMDLEKFGPKPVTEGSTDSEDFFRRWCAQGKDMDGYRGWVETVANGCRYTSLTSLLCDGEVLLACRRSSGRLFEGCPADVDPASLPSPYTLYHWTDGRSHLFCSEPLPLLGSGWRALENGELLTIHL